MASRLLTDADPVLADLVCQLIERFNGASVNTSLIITCTYRSPGEQAALYAQGRTMTGRVVTYLDGTTKASNHNVHPCRAVDLAVVVDPDGPTGPLKPAVSWTDRDAYYRMGLIAENLGLVWGGRWHLQDMPHVELPR